MTKKEILFPFLFVILSITFVLVCVMHYFSHGKSKKWVARKMRIGGLLLSLTTAGAALGQNQHPTCYDMAVVESNIITIEPENNNFTYQKEIKGNIQYRQGSKFSYCIMDPQSKMVYQANLDAVDGQFDTNNENFVIKLPEKLAPGIYDLIFYNDNKENQKPEFEKNRFKIQL